MISPLSSCFSFETSLTTSPLSTVELVHLGSSSVDETTYLGRLFNLSAHAPLREFHRGPRYSSLRRPKRRASAPSASASPSSAHASRSFAPSSLNQPPYRKPSSPVGSSTTPSSVMFWLTTILPISVLLPSDCRVSPLLRRLSRRKLSGEFRAPATSLLVMRVKGRVGARMRA